MGVDQAPKACNRPGCIFPAFAGMYEGAWDESDYCSASCYCWTEAALRVARLPWSPEVEAESKLLVEADERLNQRSHDPNVRGIL